MEWEKEVKKEDGSFQIPKTWLFIHYYEALNLLFRIENALRIFVFMILKNEVKEDWYNLSITDDDGKQDSISAIAKRRMSQAKNFGYLGYSITCPIMHLTSGELIRLMISGAYWKYFKDYFLASQGIVQSKLDEIGNIRNALAHFRPIKLDDVDLIKQISKHVLIPIEKCIKELVESNNIVPTNTTEDWYRELKTLGTDGYCGLSFFQSRDEHWIKIRMQYNCPFISKDKILEDFFGYKVLNLVSNAILQEFTSLQKFITYLSEYVPIPEMGKEYNPNFKKYIDIGFSRKKLVDNHPSVKVQIQQLLGKISEETQLIMQDNLARGRIIQAVNTYAYYRKDEKSPGWTIGTNVFSCNVNEDDPPEFWGNFDVSSSDFISNTNKYPWMPTSVSEKKSPF